MGQSKVLVVEDHPVSRKMLEAMLRKSHGVISAASGQEALSLAEENKPDLVLLDIEMPGLDGFRTLELLRNGYIEAAVPVIFLTAREDAESRERGLQAGAVDYLTKPYDRQELTIKVRNHLALYLAHKEIEAKNRIMAREMAMASQLQKALLPPGMPKNERLEFAVVYKPVSEAGGDFYDLMEFPDGSVAFAQVDVSGHGVASAMIGAMFKMVFQSTTRDSREPADLLEAINGAMFEVLPDSDYLTVFYGVINPDGYEFAFANAGHPRPFLFRKSTGDIMELSAGGPLIGAFPGMKYDQNRVKLGPGDTILVFTDGVSETRDVDGVEMYGTERLERLFLDNVHLPLQQIVERIMSDLREFSGSDESEDDITLLLIRMT